MLDVLEDNTEVKTPLKLNDDLEYYFKSTVIPQMFVDVDLILRKFSSACMKQFDLERTDLDQPIEHVVESIRYPALIEDIKKVIATNEILEKEIQATDLLWYQLNILPYTVPQERKTLGVIIAFIDITKRIRVLMEAERLKQDLIKLNADHETYIYCVSHDLQSPLQNIDCLNRSLIEAVNKGNAEEIKTFVNMLNLSVENMRKVIDELTGISKIELTMNDKINKNYASISMDFVEPEINFANYLQLWTKQRKNIMGQEYFKQHSLYD